MRNERGQADTEEFRKAVVHYRALFDELLEVREARACLRQVKPGKKQGGSAHPIPGGV